MMRNLHWPKLAPPGNTMRGHIVERSGHIPEVFRVTSPAHVDPRGSICEGWRADDFSRWYHGTNDPALRSSAFCQINVSISEPWVLRGLHYQAGKPQGKFVRCIAGSVFDVALDLRRSSATFGGHASFELRGGQAMWVPPGFAHGFLAGGGGATVVYMFTDYHDGPSERAISFQDPVLGILWPLPQDIVPTVSPRDANASTFAEITETYP